MSFFKKDVLMGIINTVAPVLGGSIGGPVGAMAMKMLSSKLLGKESGTKKELSELLLTGNSEDLVKLKELEKDFIIKIEELGLKREDIAAKDRQSARDKEIQTGDKTPRQLAISFIAGFFLVIAAQIYIGVQEIEIPDGAQRTLDTLLGVLFAMVLAVKDYYFGSSAGSTSKNETINDLLKKNSGISTEKD